MLLCKNKFRKTDLCFYYSWTTTLMKEVFEWAQMTATDVIMIPPTLEVMIQGKGFSVILYPINISGFGLLKLCVYTFSFLFVVGPRIAQWCKNVWMNVLIKKFGWNDFYFNTSVCKQIFKSVNYTSLF